WRELEVPLYFAGVRVDGKNAGRVEVVSGTGIADEVRSGVAGGPIESIQFRIIRSRHPGRGSAMKVGIARPTVGTEFAGAGNSPAVPFLPSGCSVKRSQESSHTGVSTGSANNDFIFDHQRSAGCSVMFRLVCVFDIPEQATGTGVESQQMRVIGFRENRILPDRYAPIFVRGRVIQQPRTDWPRVVPDLSPGSRIEREYVVGRGHEHHASDYDGRRFQVLRISGMKDPCHLQLLNICGIDFAQRAIAASGVVTVVGRPVVGDGSGEEVFSLNGNRTADRVPLIGHLSTHT